MLQVRRLTNSAQRTKKAESGRCQAFSSTERVYSEDPVGVPLLSPSVNFCLYVHIVSRHTNIEP